VSDVKLRGPAATPTRCSAGDVHASSPTPRQVAGKPFPKNHEGHSGWTIDSGYVSFGDGISTLVPKPAFDTVPHIVLLMIGTNDVGASMGTSTIADRLDKLLDKIVAAAPQALVVLPELTPIGYNPAPLAPYNAKIPGIVQARVAKGQHFALVDMSKMPSNQLQSDDLHPTTPVMRSWPASGMRRSRASCRSGRRSAHFRRQSTIPNGDFFLNRSLCRARRQGAGNVPRSPAVPYDPKSPQRLFEVSHR
jgi:GDSL-like lipase/acylhydrolase family protein